MLKLYPLVVLAIALLFGVLFWVVSSSVEYLFFYKNLSFLLLEGPETYLESLILKVPPHSIFMRVSFMLGSLLGGVLVAVFIGKRKRVENELRESEERFRYLSKASTEAIFFTKDGICVEANQTAADMFGYADRFEFIGLSGTDIIAPESHGIVKEHMLNNLTDPYEAIGKRKDDTLFPIAIRGKMIPYQNKEFVRATSIIDITDRKQAEDDYQTLFNEMLTGFSLHEIICDDQGNPVDYRFLAVNPAFERMTDLKMGDILGLTVLEVMPDTEPHWIELFGRVALSGEPALFENYSSELDKHFEVRAFQPAPNQFACIFADITDRKQAEKALRESEERLQQSQKMESIGTLSGGIAHDFNNILFPIVGNAEILLEDIPDDSPLRGNLNAVFNAAMRAKDLVKQILAFSRQDSHEIKLMRMQPVIKEALTLIRSTIPTSIEIKQTISKDCGIIKADPTQIHQVVMNLATNAYHAMDDTGGELKVNLKEVELSGQDLPSPDMEPGFYVCLIVADTGTGIRDNVKDRIFDPYFTTKEQGKGTGMGLATIHGIVLNAGGNIIVNSELGKGTEFQVYLPIVQPSFEQQATQAIKPIQRGTEHILLVDDEDTIVFMEKQILERLGYSVVSRTSSVEALEAFRAAPDKFDLVITDMAMPNMSGDQLAPALIKIRPDIPILLCTGFSERLPEEKAKSMGIKGFLMKPIIKKDLSKMIREVLGKGQENRN